MFIGNSRQCIKPPPAWTLTVIHIYRINNIIAASSFTVCITQLIYVELAIFHIGFMCYWFALMRLFYISCYHTRVNTTHTLRSKCRVGRSVRLAGVAELASSNSVSIDLNSCSSQMSGHPKLSANSNSNLMINDVCGLFGRVLIMVEQFEKL